MPLFFLSFLLFDFTLHAQKDNDKEIVENANIPITRKNVTSKISDETAHLPNDLDLLEESRRLLIAEMYGMMYEISGLFTELERSESLETLVDGFDESQGISDGSSLAESRKLAIKRLEEMKSNLIIPELTEISGKNLVDPNSMSVTEGFRRILENKVQDILKKTDQLSGIGAKVTELNNTSYVSQNFKKQISWSFAILVGIVILGFFFLAYKDEVIRRTIFSGDAGLQFIAIFSIIIAIILFGITGTLGGKELSALLGGISGYILGRSSITQDNKNAQKST